MPTTAAAILKELEPLGSAGYRKILCNHGAREPLFGVKISELKKIQKRIKKDYRLALDLFDSGNYDAMYLAGLIADDAQMTKQDLQHWVDSAYCSGIAECTVAWVAAESAHGWELALKWIESTKEIVAAGGWTTLSCVIALRADAELDMMKLKTLLARVQKTIHSQPNRVRYAMNGFVIALGAYVAELTSAALSAAKQIGTVMVDVGNTACKVPSALDAIRKAQTRGVIGKKRRTVKC